MPSAKILEAKKAYVAELNTKIAGSLAGVVVSYTGISVADDTTMRKELREAGVEYMVVKNTMLRRAVAGTQYEAIAEYFKGDTAIALSAEDPTAKACSLCWLAPSTGSSAVWLLRSRGSSTSRKKPPLPDLSCSMRKAA